MTGASATDIANAFNTCITRQDLSGLADLMALDHVFVDSAGGRVIGKDKCVEAWRGFFAMFPDYRNVFEHVHATDGTALITGRSECSDARLDGPALWKAVVQNGRVTEWHVLDDTPEARRALGLG